MSSFSTSPSTATGQALRLKKLSTAKVTAKDFKGFIVPVLACFNDDEFATLNIRELDKFASWLKSEKMLGVCVNSITGEGPALGFSERLKLVEAWCLCAHKYELLLMIQIGGAPFYDVLQFAEQAEELGVHAVLCLPELFYKPHTIEELVGYCKIVAKKCPTRQFLYYHAPSLTQIDFDMSEFCDLAEKVIPNFLGILYVSQDLEAGSKCLREGRAVILGTSFLMSGASLLGFDAFMCSCCNVRPDLAYGIITAMKLNNLILAKERQTLMNELLLQNLSKCETNQWVDAIKYWFNSEFQNSDRGPGFSAGPVRKFYLKKSK